MNIIVKEIREHTVTKEGPYQGQEYMMVKDRDGKQWFVGDAEVRQVIKANGNNTEYIIAFETTSKGDRIIEARFVKVHEPSNDVFTEKDKDARIRESVAIKEVGDNLRAGMKVDDEVIKAYEDWIKVNLGIKNEKDTDS